MQIDEHAYKTLQHTVLRLNITHYKIRSDQVND